MLAKKSLFLFQAMYARKGQSENITYERSRRISRRETGSQPSPQLWEVPPLPRPHPGQLHLLADQRPLPGLFTEWVLPPLSLLRGCRVACAWRGARSPGARSVAGSLRAEPPGTLGLPALQGAQTPKGRAGSPAGYAVRAGGPQCAHTGLLRGGGAGGLFPGDPERSGKSYRRKDPLSCQCTLFPHSRSRPGLVGVRPSLCRRGGSRGGVRRAPPG